MRFFLILVGFALLVGTTGCNSSTSPSDNMSLIGTWTNIDTATIRVQENENDTLHRTTLATTATTLAFQDNGILSTTRNFSYNPKITFSPDTQVTYIGTWKTIGDTLIRDTWPGSLGSIDSSKYSILSSTLKLASLVKGSAYVQTFSRIK